MFSYRCSNAGKRILHSQFQEKNINGNKVVVVGAVMLLTKLLEIPLPKISLEKSLDFLSRKSVLRPALTAQASDGFSRKD